MHCVGTVAIVIQTFIAAAPAAAQQPEVAPKLVSRPFDRVAVALPPPPDDASFIAFRQSLAAVARRRIFAELARNVVQHGFFWDGDFANSFDQRKTGAENLAAAIRLEHGSGIGWQMLADFAAEPTGAAMPTAPNTLCAPAQPSFDPDALDRLIEATHSAKAEWAFPRTEALSLRGAPRSSSPGVETLGRYFVRVIRLDAASGGLDPLRTTWARIATPDGKTGYVPPGTLMPPATPQLCYVKDITGRWRVVGFIGAGK